MQYEVKLTGKNGAGDDVAISNCGEEKLYFCNRNRYPLSASIKRL